jgi:hypothetical protein
MAVVPCCAQFTLLFRNSIKMDEMTKAPTLTKKDLLIILNQSMMVINYAFKFYSQLTTHNSQLTTH